MGKTFSRFLALAIAFLLLAAAAQREAPARILAVADVHGDLDSLSAILTKSGLIDASRRWTGDRATLVFLGDLIDRGPRSRATLDLVMELQREASRRGGSVRMTLGNHEAMVIMGDMRYVVPEDFAAFADEQSGQRRQAAFQRFSKLRAARGVVADEAEWMRTHPPGFVELREAYGPQGKYGKWLREQPAMHRIGDTIFVHGGVGPMLAAGRTVEDINSTIAAELKLFDGVRQHMIDRSLVLPFATIDELAAAAGAELATLVSKPQADLSDSEIRHMRLLQGLLQADTWLSVHPDGPLWFRGYDRWSDEEGEPILTQLTQAFRVKRFVVGHTIQPGGEVRRRFGGKAFLLETGMLQRKSAALLEISGQNIRAIYLDKVVDLSGAGTP